MIRLDSSLIERRYNESSVFDKIPLVNTIKNLFGAIIKGITSVCSSETIEKSRFLSAIHEKQYGIWFKHSLFLLGIPLFITNPHGGKVIEERTIYIKSTEQNLGKAQAMLKDKESSYIQYEFYKREIAKKAHKIETVTSKQSSSSGFQEVRVQKIRDGLFSSHYACSSNDVGVQSYIQYAAKKGLKEYFKQNHNEYVLTFPTKPPKITSGEFKDCSDVFCDKRGLTTSPLPNGNLQADLPAQRAELLGSSREFGAENKPAFNQRFQNGIDQDDLLGSMIVGLRDNK